MNAIRRLAVAAVLFATPLLAVAQAFPSKPITLICPWPAGGTTDAHLRKFAEIAQKYLGQPVVVDNKPGGGGMIGPSNMAKLAKPDGYTISQLPITAYRLPHQRQVDWDAINDFTYLIGIAGYTFGVVVKADSPFKTFRDLLDYAKTNPGKLSYGTPGTGTSPHLLMEEVGMKAGVQFLHVPFKGNADSMLGFDIVSYSPYGLVGPKGMDAQVVKTLHDAFKKTLDDPEHLKLLQQLDQVYWYKSSREYAQWAAETLQAERATIERVGLLGK